MPPRVHADSLAFLSDLPVANEPPRNGWGPIERDTSNGEAAAGDGVPMAIEGVGYAKGLGVHANSDVQYQLGGSFKRFIADVGVDDETGGGGSVSFQVYGDGVLLSNSGTMTGSGASQKVDVSVVGVQVLRLVVNNAGDGDGLDHANWANARLIGDQTGDQVYVNFQTAAATVPAGYLADAGLVYGDRGNGQSYGWSVSHADVARDREVNADAQVDGADFLQWQRGFGATDASHSQGDGDEDGDVDRADLTVWQASFGTTHPATAASEDNNAVALVANLASSEEIRRPTPFKLETLGLSSLPRVSNRQITTFARLGQLRRAPHRDSLLARDDAFTCWSTSDMAAAFQNDDDSLPASKELPNLVEEAMKSLHFPDFQSDLRQSHADAVVSRFSV